jgi:hypothetical protein
MTPQLDDLFQRHYTRARRAKIARRAPWHMVEYLRYKLVDDRLDIRELKVDGKPFMCIIRWVHPIKALGRVAVGVMGLDYIPVIVKKIARDDGLPREVTYRDIDEMILLTHELTRMAIEAQQRKDEADEREVNQMERDYKDEVLLNASPKFYQSIANENARRIESGEVQGYGTSGPAPKVD